MPQLNLILSSEAQYFHQCLFAGKLDGAVVARYVQANEVFFKNIDSTFVQKIIEKKLDVQAVELVLRHQNSQNILTKKIQILLYLLEVRSAYLPYFLNDQDRFFSAIFILAQSLLRTAYQYVKGRFLVWRHELV